MSYAKTIIVGNLGGDPESRTTRGGNVVCSFSVATTETWKDQAGEKQERTTWWRVSVWGKAGDNCMKYLAKGRQVMVEGRPQASAYISKKTGEAAASLELTADRVVFLSGSGGGQQREREPWERDAQTQGGDDDGLDGDDADSGEADPY